MSITPSHANAETTAVPILRWPAQDDVRRRLAEACEPRLLLLGPDHPPPAVVDPLGDCVREPIGPRDFDIRMATLERRAQRRAERPRFDGDGLRLADRWVDVPVTRRAAADLLIDRLGLAVRYEEILTACANTGISTRGDAVKALIGRLDKRFAQLGLQLRNVRARGYLLDHERVS